MVDISVLNVPPAEDHQLMLHFVRSCTKRARGTPDCLEINIKNPQNWNFSN